tara:strand:- start:429 stop:713 length:285 start_codon:yes stop_codon:yes gene_type:complete
MKTNEYRLTYTTLDGSRNTVSYNSAEKVERVMAKAKAEHPNHDFAEQVEVITPEQQEARFEAEIAKLKKVTFAEHMGARHLRRTSSCTAEIHGY